ncbi:hypothetical protein [Solimonas soli]|uniref:hypothetical protein n=1 Tax=Solimonas soli TaxID=413479 RepID=UPI0004B79D80|nr:hypothetical protein [Solimonas soli]
MSTSRFLAAALLCGGCSALAALPAWADAALDYVDAASGAPHGRLFVAGDKLRVDVAYAPGNSYVVVDLKTRTLTQINPQAKAQTTATVEQMQQLINGISSAADPATQPLVQLALENLDPAQRAQAEAALRQARRDENVPYAKTGARERIAGIPCEVYAQQADNGDRRTLCMATYADLGLSAHDAQTLQQAMTLLRQTGGPWVPAARLPGLPLRYAGSFTGVGDGAGVLKSISTAAQPASRFSDPPGYRIVSLFEMMSLLGAP